MTAPAMPRTIPSVALSLEVEEDSGDASSVFRVVVEVEVRAVELVLKAVKVWVVGVVVVISSVVDGVDDVDNVVVVLSWSPL